MIRPLILHCLPLTDRCASNLACLLSVFERLGFPVAEDKLEGPATSLVFEINTEEMIIRLPEEKLQELQGLVDSWVSRRSCSKKDLQSLAGKFSKVVQAGKTFLRRMFVLITIPEMHTVADKSYTTELGILIGSDVVVTTLEWGVSYISFTRGRQYMKCSQMPQGPLGVCGFLAPQLVANVVAN